MSNPINIISKKKSTLTKVDVNFDDFDENEFAFLKQKTENLCEKISKKQLQTQSNVVSFYGVDKKNKFHSISNNKMDSLEIKGDQFFVPKSMRNIKIKGNEKNSYVLSEIKNTTFFKFNSPVIHLTITNCENLVIKIKKNSLTGIECINCTDIVIDCESHSFVRTTTSSYCEISGDLNENTLIDVRNCNDIFFNKEKIVGNMFTEGRFRKRNGELYLIPIEEDLLSRPFYHSMPNMSLMKMW